jgi:D-alanyl-D-alanine carboxypeptidase (penicillin-binding protein 5/6)
MMSGAISGKTGFTGKAGYCYVGALERDGKMFIVALLACGWPNNKNYKWKDTRMLMEYGLEHYFYDNSNHINLPKIKVEDAVPIDKNIFHETYISTSTEEVQVLRNKNEEIQIITEYNKCIKAPIKKGEIIGTIKYYVGDTFVVEKPIVATESAEKKTLQCYWSAFIKLYLL